MAKRKLGEPAPDLGTIPELWSDVEVALSQRLGTEMRHEGEWTFATWIRSQAMLNSKTKGLPLNFLGASGFYPIHWNIKLLNACAPHLVPLLRKNEVGVPLSVANAGPCKTNPAFVVGPCALITPQRNLTLAESWTEARQRVADSALATSTRWACLSLGSGAAAIEILTVQPPAYGPTLYALALILEPALSKRSNWYDRTDPKRHSLELVSVPGSDAWYDILKVLSDIMPTYKIIKDTDTDKIRKLKKTISHLIDHTFDEPITISWEPAPRVHAWPGHMPFRLRRGMERDEATTCIYLLKTGSEPTDRVLGAFSGQCTNAWNTLFSESGTTIDAPDIISHFVNKNRTLTPDACHFLGIEYVAVPVTVSQPLSFAPPKPQHLVNLNTQSQQMWTEIWGGFTETKQLQTRLLDKFKHFITKEKLAYLEDADWHPGRLQKDATDPAHARMLGLEELNGVWYLDWVRVHIGDWVWVPFSSEPCVCKSLWSRYGRGKVDKVQLLRMRLNWEPASEWTRTMREHAIAFRKFS